MAHLYKMFARVCALQLFTVAVAAARAHTYMKHIINGAPTEVSHFCVLPGAQCGHANF